MGVGEAAEQQIALLASHDSGYDAPAACAATSAVSLKDHLRSRCHDHTGAENRAGLPQIAGAGQDRARRWPMLRPTVLYPAVRRRRPACPASARPSARCHARLLAGRAALHRPPGPAADRRASTRSPAEPRRRGSRARCVTLLAQIESHRPRPARARHRIACWPGRGRAAGAGLLRRARRAIWRPASRPVRAVLIHGQLEPLRRPLADDPPAAARPAPHGRRAAAGLPAGARPRAAGSAHLRAALERLPDAARMAAGRICAASGWPAWRRRAARRRTARPCRGDWSRRRRPARAWPSTSCWRASWPWRWSAQTPRAARPRAGRRRQPARPAAGRPCPSP